MTEKVKLTQEQADALKIYKDAGHNLAVFAANRRGFHGPYESLKTLSIDELGRVLYEPNSYEVEPQIKHGYWVKAVLQGNDYITYGKIDTEAFEDFVFDYLKQNNEWGRIRKHKDDLELMTPEEIKLEKNRRLWKSIGREVGELKEKDLVVYENKYFRLFNNMGCEIYGFHMDPVYASKLFDHGNINGFYPSESFIFFESEGEA